MVGTGNRDEPLILHASAVALKDCGLLIIGASGAGKSTLALELMALGADLVADDRVRVTRRAEGGLLLSAPDAIRDMIEARGLGLLAAPARPAMAAGVVDLDTTESARLPELRRRDILGESLPLLRRVESPAFASMLMLWLRGGRVAP